MKAALLCLPRIRPMLFVFSFLLVSYGLLPMAQAQCPTGDVILNSQAAVNAFPRGCTNLQGSLTISGADINDLRPLSNLQSTGTNTAPFDALLITNNPSLISLSGLSNLTFVDGNLRIENNPVLNSIAALSALTETGRDLQIINNVQLASLNGLSSLYFVSTNLRIENNPVLSSIAALSALTRTGIDLEIVNNAQLPNLNGLSSLFRVGNALRIENNPVLNSVAGLSNLRQTAGRLEIINNAQLTSLNGLSNLSRAGNSLRIENNPVLSSIAALNGVITEVSDIRIINNPQLATCAITPICVKLANSSQRVTITGNASGCSSTTEVQNVCNSLDITTPPSSGSTVCAGATVTASVSATGNVGGYQWYKGNSLLSDQTTATLFLTNVQPSDADAYVVVVSSSVKSLTSTAFNLTVNPTPTVSLSNNGPITCTRPVATLTASATPTGGTYNFRGRGANETTTSNQIFVVTPSLYTVIYTSPQGCTATATTTVDSDVAQPNVGITPTSPILSCVSPTLSLSVTGMGSIQWSTGETSPAISVTSAGTYSVILTGANGCTATATATVEGSTTPPTVSASNDGPLTCTKTFVTLSSTASPEVTYQWRGPGGFSSTTSSVTTATPGTYTLVVTSGNSCTAVATTTVEQNLFLAPPSLRTATGQSSVTVPQYSGTVTLLIDGCSGTAAWTGPNSSSGTGTTINVATTQTGTFVYQASCRLGTCTSTPTSVTVTVQAGPLKLLVAGYNCASRQLTLGTTGGNGQPLEYHINSVTSGWDKISNVFILESKHIGRDLKLRARQRNAGGGWDEAEISFTPTACGSARVATEETEVPLTVTVLGNPVVGDQVEVEVKGAEGQPLHLQVVDLGGKSVDSWRVEAAQALQPARLRVGPAAGVYLLQVATPRQQKTLRMLKR